MQKAVIRQRAEAMLIISKEGGSTGGMSPPDISCATHARYLLHTSQVSARLSFTAHRVQDL